MGFLPDYMKNQDPLDVARDHAVDASIRRAELEHEEKVMACAAAACRVWNPIPLAKLNRSIQAFWRRVAEAVLNEATRIEARR